MMKAISIRQPWAWAILHAGKRVENRGPAWDVSSSASFARVIAATRPGTPAKWFTPWTGALGLFDVPDEIAREAMG